MAADGSGPSGSGAERVGLGPERRSLVALSAAIVGGRAERLRPRLAEADEAAGGVAVEEAILQSYLFAGFPRALETLALWRERRPVVAEAGEPDDPALWPGRGEEVCRRVYATAYERLRSRVTALHPDVERWMLAEGYGKVLGRGGLDLATRELCIVGLLAAQDAPRQLHSHLRGCLNVGVAAAEVQEALEVALAEAATVSPVDVALQAQQHRAVWARVRSRHEEKMRNQRGHPREEA